MLLKDWKEKLLTLGIAIIFVLFVAYSLDTFLGGDNWGDSYNLIIFIISGVTGAVAIVVGSLVIKTESVGSGLLGGGILTVLYGLIRYLPFAKNTIRVFILGIILVILILIGIKKFSKQKLKRP